MEDKLIESQTAILAKEKGFDERCSDVFINTTSVSKFILNKISPNNGELITYCDTKKDLHYTRPSQSLLQKWLREVHNIHVSVNCGIPLESKQMCWYCNVIKFGKHHKSKYRSVFYETYEEALEIGLQQALKLI